MDTQQLRKLIEQQPTTHNAQLIETHISWVLLIGEFAYKLKKPVHYAFIDARRFETRRYFCEQELKLNRRLAPDLYLAVVPVYQSGDHLSLETGPGDVVEYAVKLKRLDPTRQMDRMLERGAVTTAHLQALAHHLADFHRQAQVIETPFSVEDLRHTFAGLAEVPERLVDHLGAEFPGQIDQVMTRADDFLRQHQQAFLRRAKAGYLRDGHGDLHAGNIFLYDRPIVFDCIEYNEGFRQIDVLNEIAFLCLSLELYRQVPAYRHLKLTDVFLRHYTNRFPCYERADAGIFQFYLLLRANIKLKVNALKVSEEETEAGRQNRLRRCEQYFELLTRYAAALP
jgi:uncharacterized protein